MARPEDDARLGSTARRVGHENWRGVNRLGEELLAWNYRITADQLPTWKLQHAQSIAAPGWPRSIQSAWSGPKDALALFDVFECASRLEAHSFLVRLLASVESAELEYQAEPPAGDVMFARGRSPVRIFARGNIVFFLRTADRKSAPIAQTAVRLDRQLTSKPRPPRRARELPAIERFRAAAEALRPGEVVPLEVQVSDPAREALWYKAFTGSGELWLSEGRPVYRQTSLGPADINLYAVAPGRGAAHERLIVPDRADEG